MEKNLLCPMCPRLRCQLSATFMFQHELSNFYFYKNLCECVKRLPSVKEHKKKKNAFISNQPEGEEQMQLPLRLCDSVAPPALILRTNVRKANHELQEYI